MRASRTAYSTGEPPDYSLLWVGIGYMILAALLTVSFISKGYGGALFGMILLCTRLLLFAFIPWGVVWGIVSLRRRRMDGAIVAFLAVPLAIIGLVVLAAF